MIPMIPMAPLDISIHAPREGGDLHHLFGVVIVPVISIHAPREGGDRCREWRHHIAAISIHAPPRGGRLSAAPA